MIPLITLVPYIFLFLAGLVWFKFIKELLSTLTKNRSKGQPGQNNRSNTVIKRNVQSKEQSRVDMRTNTRNVPQSRRNNSRTQESRKSSGSINAQNIIENLFKQTPQELYRLLVNNLPEKYHDEVKQIFNSQSWKRNLWSFVRRKDVWPLLQNVLRTEVTEKLDQNESTRSNRKKDYSVRTTASTTGSVQVNESEEDFEKDYDSFERMYDDISSSLASETFSSNNEELVVSKNITNKKNKSKEIHIDKKWLKNAVIAKEILKRPNF